MSILKFKMLQEKIILNPDKWIVKYADYLFNDAINENNNCPFTHQNQPNVQVFK